MKQYKTIERGDDCRAETCMLPGKAGRTVLRIALVFPNIYYVGMSNLGLQAVYRIFNSRPDVVCERFFLPDGAVQNKLGTSRAKLVACESERPLNDFHIIAFSLSFENDYLNILTMLRLGGVPVLQRQRTARSPLVIAGGVGVFLNPEPIADIFDLLLIGEAEELGEEFLDVVRSRSGARWRRPALSDFAGIKGVYVPSAYSVAYTPQGHIASFDPNEGFPREVPCRIVRRLDRFPAASCFRSRDTELSDMTLLEVSRGCSRQCRFCAVGSVYRPYRARSLEALAAELDGMAQDNLKVGVLGAAVSDHPDLAPLLRHIAGRGGSASVSSLRADALTEEMVSLLQQCGHRTFSIAPETGSERLRAVIGKRLSDEEICRAVRLLARTGVRAMRLYFMIGLPTETDQDVQEIVRLTREIKHVYVKEVHSDRQLEHIQLSISPFVPKPATPFQWYPFEYVESLKQKLKTVSSELRRDRTVTVSHDLPKWGYVQALLSRGDRRVGKILMHAFECGGDWSRAFRESDVNPDFYVYRQRTFDERLPWDFIKHAVGKKALWEEYRKAVDA